LLLHNLRTCSSTEAVDDFNAKDVRLVVRVKVLVSAVFSRLATDDFASPMEVRPLADIVLLWVRPAALVRRELVIDPVSFVFFTFSAAAAPLPSDLFITSARAFPMEDKFKDCRIEFRVVGLDGRKPVAPGVDSVGMTYSPVFDISIVKMKSPCRES
jgi:hypothetical protein